MGSAKYPKLINEHFKKALKSNKLGEGEEDLHQSTNRTTDTGGSSSSVSLTRRQLKDKLTKLCLKASGEIADPNNDNNLSNVDDNGSPAEQQESNSPNKGSKTAIISQ